MILITDSRIQFERRDIAKANVWTLTIFDGLYERLLKKGALTILNQKTQKYIVITIYSLNKDGEAKIFPCSIYDKITGKVTDKIYLWVERAGA